jgi:carbon-monoxide dehydrogenase small subunit
VKSCTLFAVKRMVEHHHRRGSQAERPARPDPAGLQEMHGLQCGFCTPAMMLVSKALLDRNPDPSEDDIRWELSGNLCRCTGYVNIVKAIQWAAKERATA